MNYYIIAGEASGDLHASNLMREIKVIDRSATFRCWGGDLMEQEGGTIVKHYRDLAFMGFWEVITNLRTIIHNIGFCKKDILDNKPDVLILVDYPGFNLRIAEFAKQNKINVVYYISPQVWAWKQSRVHKIKRNVDKMLVILPFEKDFYRKFSFDVEFVGHPLLDAIDNYKESESSLRSEFQLDERPVIALLPGSRKQEIGVMLPLMLNVAKHFPDKQFIVAGAPSLPATYYENFLKGTGIKIINNNTYNLLSIAEAALVTSGTATLETALFEVPEVVCYKGNTISYHIARRLIKVDYISLVNLIMNREIVKELIQQELNEENLVVQLKLLLNNATMRDQMINDFKELKNRLGGKGASKRAAQNIVDFHPDC